MSKSKLPDSVLADMERVTPVIRLIESVLTHKSPGSYDFADSFPEQAAIWNEVAAKFEASDMARVQTMGFRMKKLLPAIDEVDAAVRTGKNIVGPAMAVYKALGLLVRAVERTAI
ncbi:MULTISPECIES: hypothetical protein [Paenibacillus]|uniref:hypothetical protein n=1 Tax=Paenibacillus TaxID=44249 RepID=UPI001F0FD038|nr:hypothetical protein [Paenibacillus polymyxa]UMR35892.1 hypothetical protein MJ749_25260 [Paenibacillus polymyxa]